MAYTLPKIPTINELAAKLPTYTAAKPTPTVTPPPPPPAPVPAPVAAPKAPTTTVKPASPSATPVAKPAAITTPAAQQYVQTQIASTAPVTDKYTDLLNSAPLNVTASVPQSAYLDFLRKQFDPVAAEKASKDITELSQRTNEELLRTRAEEDRIRKNDIGQIESGLNFSLNEEARKSNKSLADLALAKGVAVDVYNTMLSAGKTVYEAEQAANKAAQDQLNSNRSFRLDVEQARTNEEKIKADQAFNEKKFNEDVRQFNKNYALEAQKVAIAQSKANQENQDVAAAKQKQAEDAAGSVNLINQVLQSGKLGQITGIPDIRRFLPGTAAQQVKNQYNQIKDMLALNNRDKLKGQGAVSDFEGKMLARASSSLGNNLSDRDAEYQLKQVRGAILTSHGLTSDVLLKDPRSGQSQVVNTDSAGIARAVQDGLIVEYQ